MYDGYMDTLHWHDPVFDRISLTKKRLTGSKIFDETMKNVGFGDVERFLTDMIEEGYSGEVDFLLDKMKKLILEKQSAKDEKHLARIFALKNSEFFD